MTNNMQSSPYLPIYELTRGKIVECIHYGAAAVVNSQGELVASYADPNAVTFLRSTSKPIQAIPFVERGGHQKFGLEPNEVAIMCASHSGTDRHVEVIQSIQSKAGLKETDLLCGVHPVSDPVTLEAMRARNEQPTPNRHNCSGKHTGMLALDKLMNETAAQVDEGLPYIDVDHPVQQEIIRTFAEMCRLPVDQVEIGIDGCSVPVFGVPLYNAARAFAVLSDPVGAGLQSQKRVSACQLITQSMMSNPDMVAGPGRFDTRLMEVSKGRIFSKGGAEGFQGIGIMPGALGEDSPGMGIALKISDGDARNKVRAAVGMEILKQLGALSDSELAELSEFGPDISVTNWRKIVVGKGYPTFSL
jgi:L-asparaginase II